VFSAPFGVLGPTNAPSGSASAHQPRSGERRKLPQRGPGRSLGRKLVLVHFELEKKNKSGVDEFDILFSFAGGGGARPWARMAPPVPQSQVHNCSE